ncbi:MAG TPA: 50S ribosomal protein L24 [Gammaproteobacteria bacterium]|nr:50S ribosomal protein L24 [Gammaproteobacteria bacterium]
MRKIKKGDLVILIAGKDKGRKGTVLAVLKGGEMLVVEGVNTAKKHVKANPNTGDRGGIIIKTQPIHRSNVMLYDQASDKGTRVGIRTLENGKNVRYFKSTNEVVDV